MLGTVGNIHFVSGGVGFQADIIDMMGHNLHLCPFPFRGNLSKRAASVPKVVLGIAFIFFLNASTSKTSQNTTFLPRLIFLPSTKKPPSTLALALTKRPGTAVVSRLKSPTTAAALPQPIRAFRRADRSPTPSQSSYRT